MGRERIKSAKGGKRRSSFSVHVLDCRHTIFVHISLDIYLSIGGALFGDAKGLNKMEINPQPLRYGEVF